MKMVDGKCLLHLHEILMVLLVIWVGVVAASNRDDEIGLPGCPTRCGDVVIPYPYGLTPNCSLNEDFLIKCNTSSTPPTPIFGKNIVVTNISVQDHELTILWFVARDCLNGSNQPIKNQPQIRMRALTISNSKNKFIVIGCGHYAYLDGFKNGTYYRTGCKPSCQNRGPVPKDGSCSGVRCCQMDVPQGLKSASITPPRFNISRNNISGSTPCSYAFLVQQKHLAAFSPDYLYNFDQTSLPIVAEWAIQDTNRSCEKGNNTAFCLCGRDNTVPEFSQDGLQYNCRCNKGYRGNPYIPDGCREINECTDPAHPHNCTKDQYCVNAPGSFICKDRGQLPLTKIAIGTAMGFIGLLLVGSWLHLVHKKRKLIQLKEKYFRQNGGLILQQQLSREDNSSKETATKIFTEEELRKATLNYDDSTIIGRGGFGTVYKGFLPDNRIVAIKKSKLVDQNQIEQFINEVAVVSQINHRNVVKLLGCCLETEVPLLVYEFVPDGTLHEHIHNENKASNLLWETRLGIAAETAEALSYLHSAASTQIIHRDVKPSNILLDNYTAKVSDFGASRLVPLDQTELATMVQGTLGYLDPEYMHTNQLTEKSDVYSFGVVLLELLTGEKAISFQRPEEERSLAMYFFSALREGRLLQVLDRHIVSEGGNREQVEEVARLAKRCLNVKGEDRPTMKRVAVELQGLRKMDQKHPWAINGELMNLGLEETAYLLAQTSISYQDNETSNTIPAYDHSVMDHVILDFNGR